VKQKRLLIISDGARLLLEKRPPSGIWGGLWSLPELDIDEPVEACLEQNWSLLVTGREDQPVYRHTFSHFHLDITPTRLSVAVAGGVMDDGVFSWHADIAGLGLAAPVRKLLAGAV
jgi:A/G-specific adenine glycosylase